MIKKLNKVSVGLFVAALSVAALAVQDSVNLKRAVKEGDTAKYRLKGTVDFQGQDIVMTMLITEKVTKVESNGNYTVESTESEGKVDFGGDQQDIPGETMSTIYKATGEVVDVKTDADKKPSAIRLANLQSFVVQDKAVKVGDEWATEVKKDAASGAFALKGTYKVEAQEKVGEIDCYKVKFSAKEAEGGDAAASVDGYSWVNIKTGLSEKTEGATKNAPYPSAPFPVNLKFSMTHEK